MDKTEFSSYEDFMQNSKLIYPMTLISDMMS